MSDNYTAVQRFADALGFDVGQTNSKVQAELLNGLARGLSRGQQRIDVERQNCYIVEDLTRQAKDYLTELVGMIETVDNERR